MPCQLRKPDLPNPHGPSSKTRMQKLQQLICGGPWNARDNICLLYWRPKLGDDGKPRPDGAGEWVAWVDSPPKVDPLPDTGVTIAP